MSASSSWTTLPLRLGAEAVPNVVCYKEKCPYNKWKDHHMHRCSRRAISLNDNGVCESEELVKKGFSEP